jgi:hypothetical protein
MKVYLFILTWMILPFAVFSTAQISDILWWNGKKYMLYSVPLFKKPGFKAIQNNLFGGKKGSFSTGCWRGQKAEWIIINNELYLKNILSCDYENDGIKADLQSLFGAECKNGMVKASWVTDTLILPIGKLMHYVHDGFGSIYEKEIFLSIHQGKLKKHWTADNSKTYESYFLKNPDSFNEFFYKSINWEIIPDMGDKTYRVLCEIRSGAKRKPDSIGISKGANLPILNQEALRALKLLPEWSVYYRHGKVFVQGWGIQLRFSEELRKKYAPK